VVISAVCVLWLALPSLKAADTLPGQFTDAEFWRMVTDFSEPGGAFPYENFVSNEVSYQDIIPDLTRIAKPGGAYLGVATEQNFTYIAAIKPKVAFVLDIRRQNMIELLMYKALFEMSADRVEFISRLFSRSKPAGLTAAASAEEIFKAFEPVGGNSDLYKQTLQAIKDRLVKQHQFKFGGDDEQKIDYVFNVFFRGGPRMDYAYASSSPNNQVPSYYNLMVTTDGRGKNWAYLETEERYKFVREMQLKNLIVPLVADFSGPKTLKTIAQYLKDCGSMVSVFYISNVEDYLNASWPSYSANLAALPADDSTLLIRFVPVSSSSLGWIKDLPQRWPGQYWLRRLHTFALAMTEERALAAVLQCILDLVFGAGPLRMRHCQRRDLRRKQRRHMRADRGVREPIAMVFQNSGLRVGEAVQVRADWRNEVPGEIIGVSLLYSVVERGAADAPICSFQLSCLEIRD
jgi:hypothetical protein